MNIVQEDVWDQLEEVEVVLSIFIVSIQTVIYEIHHVERCVLVVAKAFPDCQLLSDFSEG